MFHPARMTRVLVGGHRARMQDVIDVLHKERAIHLEDYEDPTGVTGIGTPLEQGDEASALLVRTRGMLKALEAEDLEGREMTAKDPAALLADAEAELSPVIDEAAELRNQVQAMRSEVDHLRPFASIDAELSALTTLRSVQGYMGTVRDDPRGALDAAGVPHETGIAGNAIILIVPREHTDAADRVLSEAGFSAVAVPEGAEGTPAQRIAKLESEVHRSEERLLRAEQRLAGHREQWGPRLAALERHLSSVVDKTQAPLRFGVTDTTFHIEGWIPRKRANRVRNALSARFGDNIYFEELGDAAKGHDGHDDHHSDAKDEAPVKLENKGLAKPYEFLLGLLGRPRYQEIDPTKLMLLFFPLFFGLMVGDLVIGLAIMGVGFYLKNNKLFGIGGPSVGRAIIAGGLMSAIIGGLVFGEGLGMHFVADDEALEEGEISWEAVIYGKEEVLHGEAGFPTEGFIHKEVKHHDEPHDEPHADPTGNATGNGTTNGTVGDPLLGGEGEEDHGGGGLAAMFSPEALKPHGETHLSVNGWFNLGYYSKTHDTLALLVWSMLIGFVHLVMGLLIGVRNVAKGHGVTLAIQEKASWLFLIVGVGVLIYGLTQGGQLFTAVGAAISVASVALLWMGVQKVLGAGFISLLEIPGFVGNILSYTRLAAIGASKAGMAIAFADIAFQVIGGGNLHSIGGWIFYLIGSALILVLAIIAGFLQSLRLQFVEFFGKFYEGGGRPYLPFGRRSP